MLLERNSPDRPHHFRGAGSVNRDRAGRLALTMFAAGARPTLDATFSPVGSVVGDDEYYTLSATDEFGRRWQSRRVLPEVTWSAGGSVIVASLNDLVTERGDATEIANAPWTTGPLAAVRAITVYVAEELSFPENASTVTVVSDGGDERRSRRRDFAQFVACGCEFTLRREAGWTTLGIAPSLGTLPCDLYHHAVDALTFVLARRVTPGLIKESAGQFERVTLLSTSGPGKKPMLHPPVPQHTTRSAEYTWKLFGKYLEYMCAENQPAPHPLSVEWRIVLSGSASSLEVAALVYSVAVEAVLREMTEVPHAVASTTKPLKRWMRTVRAFTRKYGCPAEVHRLIDQALQRALQPRATDKLRALVARSAVEQHYVTTWSALRNRSAHGARRAYGDHRALLYACDEVSVLLHQLVYAVIGYDGLYARFEDRRWKAGMYPPSTATTPGA